jgi:hypothetical protein
MAPKRFASGRERRPERLDSCTQWDSRTPLTNYDSRLDTWQHIHEVRGRLAQCIKALMDRQHNHDLSKLTSPEREVSDVLNVKLAGLTYGTEEYWACQAEFQAVLDQHARSHRHHPECSGGITGMNLIDLVEMLCDWKAAAAQRGNDIRRSIELNQARFGYSDELKQILLNTLEVIEG